MVFFKKNWMASSSAMTPERMEALVRQTADRFNNQGSVFEFSKSDCDLALIFDQQADRMRIISAIAEVAQLEPEHLQRAMEANFHSALDARYCIGNDILWSAFIHPLASLDAQLLLSAIDQVIMARLTFGTHYSSGNLHFPGSG